MTEAKWEIKVVSTTPFAGQACGTSGRGNSWTSLRFFVPTVFSLCVRSTGLRKKVTEFQKPHYLENFTQAVFNSLPADEVKGCTLVLSGDGRFYNKEASQTIIRIAAANGVAGIIVAQNFLCSTPAVSHIIRSRKAYGERRMQQVSVVPPQWLVSLQVASF